MSVKQRNCKTCNTTKNYYALGLCRSCYHKEWQHRLVFVPATCHPSRRHQARGFCRDCYKLWLFSVNPAYKERALKQQKKWKQEVGDERRKWVRMLKRFGIGKTDYLALLEKQNNVCFICGGVNPSGWRLAVDHNHSTGKVRGLLCQRCNTHLGWLEDHRARIEKYLQEME